MKKRAKQIHRTESQIRALLNLYSESDGTVVEFCRVNKIQKGTFYAWRNKYDLVKEKQESFIPIQFDQPSLPPALFAEVEMTSNITIRIYQPVEASWIKSLLR